MGALLSIPLAGSLGTVATSAIAGCAFCFTSKAASLAFKSCNCNSSIATRVGFALIFSLNSLLAWLMKTPWAVKQIQKISLDYIKINCTTGKCYGVLAIHRICFALALFHLILSASLIGVKNTRTRRAEIQNGWWGPKVVLWLVLLAISFFIPNGFFIFWGNWVALLGSVVFILIGLVLLVDFAHSFTEMCLTNWENSNGSNLWQYILVGSTFGLYAVTITLTGVMYGFFAGSGCTLNQFFITFNWILCLLATLLCIAPPIQEANPKSGLAQASMVAAYCTYLIMSAVGNHTHASCNPLHKSAGATQTTTVVIGGVFTFIAIAYSTTRAATLSKAFSGTSKKGAIALSDDNEISGLNGGRPVITSQPVPKNTPRYQALLAAVEAGAIPASALNDRGLYSEQGVDGDSDDEDDSRVAGEERDDEKVEVRYNYSWFHIIFAMAAMYVAMLLTDWQIMKTGPDPTEPGDSNIYIGRSDMAMWMRVVSSWVSIMLYAWSLLAPVVMPDRFGDWD